MSSDPGINHTMKYSSDVTNTLQVLVGGGKQRSPRKHWRGQFHKSNEEGPPKDNDNQQTLYVTSYGGCWYNKFGDCFIHQHQTYNKLMLVQMTTGSAPMDNTSFQLQILNRISPKKQIKYPSSAIAKLWHHLSLPKCDLILGLWWLNASIAN